MSGMGSWLASDTDALQFGPQIRLASFDFAQDGPGARALPVFLNHFPICVIRVIRGKVLSWREEGDPPSQGCGDPWATARLEDESITLGRAN
jgi:hypothetical protein